MSWGEFERPGGAHSFERVQTRTLPKNTWPESIATQGRATVFFVSGRVRCLKKCGLKTLLDRASHRVFFCCVFVYRFIPCQSFLLSVDFRMILGGIRCLGVNLRGLEAPMSKS